MPSNDSSLEAQENGGHSVFADLREHGQFFQLLGLERGVRAGWDSLKRENVITLCHLYVLYPQYMICFKVAQNDRLAKNFQGRGSRVLLP